MPKRGIDTPAKDDPNRKKPRQKDPVENANIEESKSKTDPSASVAAPKAPVAAPTPTGSSKIVKTATAATSKPKHAAATVGVSKSLGGSLLDVFRSGNSVEAKAPAADMTDKKEKKGTATKSTTDKKSKPSIKEPEVKAEIKNEGGPKDTFDVHKRSMWGLGAVAALGVLNVASVSYLVSEQARFNALQMRCHVENEKLSNDLSRNQGLISVLKSGLEAAENQIKFIEQAQENKRKEREERREKKEFEGVLTSEERNKWSEKKKFLANKRDQLLDEFNSWLAKLNNKDGME